MARRRRALVAGEPLEPLLAALLTVFETAKREEDGMWRAECTLPAEQALPLSRALMRLEAELLRNDARELGRTDAVNRTPDQRRHDAFMLLMERVVKAQQAQTAARRPAA